MTSHAPCAYCGKPLLRRKDGTPRQHRADLRPGKNDSYRIERELLTAIDADMDRLRAEEPNEEREEAHGGD